MVTHIYIHIYRNMCKYFTMYLYICIYAGYRKVQKSSSTFKLKLNKWNKKLKKTNYGIVVQFSDNKYFIVHFYICIQFFNAFPQKFGRIFSLDLVSVGRK